MGTPTRITPALAGKSYVFGPFRPGSWDHPRVGGEKQIGGDNGLDKQGSPPRGRGKVDSLSRQLTGSGITPAWAGKSKEPLKICEKQEDHPRVGGEKLDLLAVVFSALGSPPRGRGKESSFRGCRPCLWITPAWAGKSESSSAIVERRGDHPRVGGEKLERAQHARAVQGSPPRGRGKALLVVIRYSREGITPAWAGKSRRGHIRTEADQDHPRVGGEKATPL